MTLATAGWWERRLTATQGRYVRACESLVRVRRFTRLGPSALQVNSGGQHINVVGDGATGEEPTSSAA